MTRIDQIKWKPDDKGRPRYLPATYIMKKDPNARMAYKALRRRGVSRAEAEHTIELVCFKAFREMLVWAAEHLDQDPRTADRRPEMWFMLAEGMPVEKIFPDRPPKQQTN